MTQRTGRRARGGGPAGPVIELVRWRDIPAQVIARNGGETVKHQLSDRFQEAIDRAAMRGGARETDAYLAEWRRDPPEPCDPDLAAAVADLARRIEADYDDARLRTLVADGGHDGDPAATPSDPDAASEKGSS